ncbi:MAG: hypothetical protein PHQ89_03050 [Bacilli bacterium]|nr:hypothetical protein [Bacilli bacterium]
MNDAKKFVTNECAKKIRKIMNRYNCLYLDNYSSYEKFELIKKLSSLISELLKDRKLKIKFIELISKSTVNGDNPELRLATFEMIRNLSAHFPMFDIWNDVFVNNQLLTWDDPTFPSIKKYFDKYKGKILNYDIYIKGPFGWEKRHTVNFKIPRLEEKEKMFLKNVISEDDVIWTFCLIDSLLEYLGFDIIDCSGYSL